MSVTSPALGWGKRYALRTHPQPAATTSYYYNCVGGVRRRPGVNAPRAASPARTGLPRPGWPRRSTPAWRPSQPAARAGIPPGRLGLEQGLHPWGSAELEVGATLATS